VRAHPWLLPATIVVLAVAGCSDDDGGGSTSPSSAGGGGATSAPGPAPTGEACELVTRADAEAVFGAPARPATVSDDGADSVCAWQGPDELLEYRIHEGGSIQSQTVNTGGGNVITMQWSNGGRACQLRYIGTGDTATTQAAIQELAQRVDRCAA
jgi:hypothetical protein